MKKNRIKAFYIRQEEIEITKKHKIDFLMVLKRAFLSHWVVTAKVQKRYIKIVLSVSNLVWWFLIQLGTMKKGQQLDNWDQKVHFKQVDFWHFYFQFLHEIIALSSKILE